MREGGMLNRVGRREKGKVMDGDVGCKLKWWIRRGGRRDGDNGNGEGEDGRRKRTRCRAGGRTMMLSKMLSKVG